MRFRFALALAVLAALAALAGTAFAIAGSKPVDYSAAGGHFTGVRPTALGLPLVGASGTVGAGDLSSSLRSYHDSGRYASDIAAVDGAAQAYLDRRLAEAARPARRVRRCRTAYRRVRTCVGGRRRVLYSRRDVCRTVRIVPPRVHGKPAIVLDIDETSLSNYSGLVASDFSSTGTAVPAAAGTGTAIAPTLALYHEARRRGVAVFFITGRPEALRSTTERNLRSVGYDQGWDGLTLKPGGTGTEAYKAGARAALQTRGYDILVNVGDQESDLDGGHADRAFKVPNPFYFISD